MLLGRETILDELISCLKHPVRGHLSQSSHRQHKIGHRLINKNGLGMQFKELRQYQAGDDRRFIHWRASAKTGTFQTKVFHQEIDRPHHVYLNMSESLFFGSKKAFKSVRLIEATALLLEYLLYQKSDVQLHSLGLNNNVWKSRTIRNQNDLILALKDLANLSQNKLTESRNETYPALPIVKKGETWLLGDWLADSTDHPLWLALQRQSKGTLIHVSDPLEDTLPPSGAYPLIKQGKTLWIDINAKNKQILKDKRSNSRQLWQKECQQQHWQWLELVTNQDPREVLNECLMN